MIVDAVNVNDTATACVICTKCGKKIHMIVCRICKEEAHCPDCFKDCKKREAWVKKRNEKIL